MPLLCKLVPRDFLNDIILNKAIFIMTPGHILTFVLSINPSCY